MLRIHVFHVRTRIVLHQGSYGMRIGSDFSLDEFRKFSDLIEDDVYDAISLETCVNKRTITGAPAPDTVKKYLDNL